MRGRTGWIGILLLSSLLFGCGGGDESTSVDDTAADADLPSESVSTSTTSELGCPTTTTTTTGSGSTSSTGPPRACDVLDDLPPDQREAITGSSELWWGEISGSIQTPGCEAVSQSGELILGVDEGGSIDGVGFTQAGAYTCDNGASIPEMFSSYTITGRMTDRFTLTFSTGGGELTSGPIEDDAATVVQDTGAGQVTIELSCNLGC